MMRHYKTRLLTISPSIVTQMIQQKQATLFHKLHQNVPLILPNAWDAASARVIEQSGVSAIATTSAGIAWANGFPDGECLSRDQMVRQVRAIVNVTKLPVTADIESGYGNRSVQDVGATVEAVLAAGVVGINLEDTPGEDGAPILSPATQAERIQEARNRARSAGIDLFINARTDVYLAPIGDENTRLSALLDRAALYIEAGANGIFVPGLTALQSIKTLTQNIPVPLNIMAGPGCPSINELQQAGVARISLGPSLALATLSLTRAMTRELLSAGTYTTFVHSESEHCLSFPEANQLFSPA